MNRLFLIINEDFRAISQLEDKLKNIFKIPEKTLRELYKSSDGNAAEYTKKLEELNNKYQAEAEKANEVDDIYQDKDIDLIDSEIPGGYEAPEKEKSTSDDSIVDVLDYLGKLWRNKDRVRVIAARFKIDPEIYLAAGLGQLPENYSDQDVWNTMDMSRNGSVEFKNSIWQPYYIESMERLQELPSDVKQEIAEIIQKRNEEKKNVSYPKDSNNPYNDDGMTYESKAKLAEPIIIENKDGSITILDIGSLIVF